MSHTTLASAIEGAKKFAMDTAIIQSNTSGDFAIIRSTDIPTIPDTFKHVATVRVILSHEVIRHG